MKPILMPFSKLTKLFKRDDSSAGAANAQEYDRLLIARLRKRNLELLSALEDLRGFTNAQDYYQVRVSLELIESHLRENLREEVLSVCDYLAAHLPRTSPVRAMVIGTKRDALALSAWANLFFRGYLGRVWDSSMKQRFEETQPTLIRNVAGHIEKMQSTLYPLYRSPNMFAQPEQDVRALRYPG